MALRPNASVFHKFIACKLFEHARNDCNKESKRVISVNDAKAIIGRTYNIPKDVQVVLLCELEGYGMIKRVNNRYYVVRKVHEIVDDVFC
jgi:predicted transcriptional regulator of viral defense system